MRNVQRSTDPTHGALMALMYVGKVQPFSKTDLNRE
jgi:hypothetical protein